MTKGPLPFYLSDVPCELTVTQAQFRLLSRFSQNAPWTIPNNFLWSSRRLFLSTMESLDKGHNVGLVHANTCKWEPLHPWPVIHAPDNANLTFKLHGISREEWDQLTSYAKMMGLPSTDDVLDSAMDFYLYVCKHVGLRGAQLQVKTDLEPVPQPFFFSAKT